MHQSFAKRLLLRRVVALVAAYAIALSSLIASLGAVRAAVADATSSGVVICQPTLLGQTTPSGIPADCDNSCCIGCLVLLAAVPPPSAASVVIAQTPGRLLPLPAVAERPSDPQTKSHRSRAPPLAA